MGGGQWEAKHVFVFRRLFLWREKEAERRDESPSYICRGSLLLDAAEFLPTSISSLMKLQSPLPASMRSDASGGCGGADGTVDLVGAVNEALSVWDVVVRKQVSSPFAERSDGSAPEGHREKHVPKIPVNGVRSYEKVESKPSTAIRADGAPGPGAVPPETNEKSDPPPKMVEIRIVTDSKSDDKIKMKIDDNSIKKNDENNIKNEDRNIKKNEDKNIEKSEDRSESNMRNVATPSPTFAFSGPALLLGAVIALGAVLVVRMRR